MLQVCQKFHQTNLQNPDLSQSLIVSLQHTKTNLSSLYTWIDRHKEHVQRCYAMHNHSTSGWTLHLLRCSNSQLKAIHLSPMIRQQSRLYILACFTMLSSCTLYTEKSRSKSSLNLWPLATLHHLSCLTVHGQASDVHALPHLTKLVLEDGEEDWGQL